MIKQPVAAAPAKYWSPTELMKGYGEVYPYEFPSSSKRLNKHNCNGSQYSL